MGSRLSSPIFQFCFEHQFRASLIRLQLQFRFSTPTHPTSTELHYAFHPLRHQALLLQAAISEVDELRGRRQAAGSCSFLVSFRLVLVFVFLNKVPKYKTRVVIDSRFNRMFNDKRFASSSAPLEKRGKPKKENSQSSLRHYYYLKDDVVSEGDDSEEVDEESESSKLLEKDSDGESEEDEEGSKSGSTTEEEDIDIVYENGEPEIQVENVPMIEKETRRLAVVNMDWRHVKICYWSLQLNYIILLFVQRGI
ncbi:hypothetical protein CRYUN_Cryun17cG0052500 [Craigia yunnanensis]